MKHHKHPLAGTGCPGQILTRRHFLRRCGTIAACVGGYGLLAGSTSVLASQKTPAPAKVVRRSTVGIVKSMAHDLVCESW